MKKLKLKALELGAKEVLTREQLKSVLGGGADVGSNGSGKQNKCTSTCVGNDVPYVCNAVVQQGMPTCQCPVSFASACQ